VKSRPISKKEETPLIAGRGVHCGMMFSTSMHYPTPLVTRVEFEGKLCRRKRLRGYCIGNIIIFLCTKHRDIKARPIKEVLDDMLVLETEVALGNLR
jgi:hypothetical protein